MCARGQVARGGLNYAEYKANTHVYAWVCIAPPGNKAWAVIKKFEMNKHT